MSASHRHPARPGSSPSRYPRHCRRMNVEKSGRLIGSFCPIGYHRDYFNLLNWSDALRCSPFFWQHKSAHWQLAVTPKDTVAGNFVPKLDFFGYYHATCNYLWHRILVRRDRRLWWTMIFVPIRFVIEGQLGT
jgi:hypothetical protein